MIKPNTAQHTILNYLSSSGLLLLVAAYIILTPAIDLLPIIGRYDEKRLLECLLLLFASISLMAQPGLRDAWIKQIHHLPRLSHLLLTSLVLLGLLSALQASQPGRALLELSLYILLFIACLHIATLRHRLEHRFDTLIGHALLLSCAFSLTHFLAALAAAHLEPGPLMHWDLFGNFSHIRFFSQFQSWTLPLIVLPLLLIKHPRGLRLWLPLLLASGWWFLMFSSGTRGTLLGLIVAAIVTALAFGRHALPWFKWQGMALLGGLLAYALIFLLPPFLSSLSPIDAANGVSSSAVVEGTLGRAWGNASGRFQLWQVAWTMASEHPWLGVGPMHYACGISNGIAAHPHSAPLQIAAEWGLPAALITLSLILWGAWAWIRQGRAQFTSKQPASQAPAQTASHAMLYPALLASLTAAATHALFSGVIVMPLSQVTLILVIGWMLGIYFQSAQLSTTQPINNKDRTLWLILVIAASAGLTAGIAPDLMHFGELLNNINIPEGARHLMPRFWQQGLICG